MKLLKKIPFAEIDGIPELIKDFLKGNLKGAEGEMFNLENLRTKISAREESFSPTTRETLFRVIESQMATLPLSGSQQENLRLLKETNTFTVTTGHQLNLFSGPVFFIYKILQTIKSAAYLTAQFPERNFVSVFWMATEDHDFEEISFFRTENGFYEIKGKSGGPVGRINIEDTAFISEFEEEFRDSVFGTELIQMMKEVYAEGKTLAEATKILVQRLFSEYGLLIIDGDDAEVKALMKPVFKDELLNRSLYRTSREQVDFLTEQYGKVQVNPREINLFYFSETRNRIDHDGEHYILVDTGFKFTEDEILQELDSHPERFSPNALMRAVYQETVLPNIAYIGGNAEIMYWLELTDYFREIKVPFPILVPRNSMLFLKDKTLQKINRMGLTVDDFFRDYTEIANRKLLGDSAIMEVLATKEKALEAAFEEIKNLAGQTDKTFMNLVAAEETRQLKSYQRMKKRLLRAEKIKQHELVDGLQRLYLQIHPSKNWQERVLNFSVFYANEGSTWLETCLREMDVTKSELIVVGG